MKFCEKLSPYLCKVDVLSSTTESLSMTKNGYVLLALLAGIIISICLIRNQNRLIKNICILSTGPIITFLFSIFNITWATQASLQAPELLSYINFEYWKNNDQISTVGMIFLFAITLVILLTLIRDKGNKYLQERERTLPTSDVIYRNSEKLKEETTNLYKITNAYMEVVKKDDNKKDAEISLVLTEGYILDTLKNITNITQKWTEHFCGDAKFNINFFSLIDVKNVKETIETDATLRDSINHSPFFLFNDNLNSKLDHCDYILVCNKNFSTSNKDGIKDNDKISLVMPYSTPEFTNNNNKAHPNFIGAPKSLEQGSIQYIKNTDNIDKTLNRLLNKNKVNNHITPEFKKDIIDYYKYDTTMSVLSIPIYDKGVKNKPLGVINIYSDINDPFQNKRHEILYNLIIPHVFNIEIMIPIFYSLIEVINKNNNKKDINPENQNSDTVTVEIKNQAITRLSGAKLKKSILSVIGNIKNSNIKNKKGGV
jgi:hypothetical protein